MTASSACSIRPWSRCFHSIIAAAAMALSSVSVIGNSLRLRRSSLD